MGIYAAIDSTRSVTGCHPLSKQNPAIPPQLWTPFNLFARVEG